MASEQYNYGDDWPADLETCFKLCQKLALPFYKDGSPLVMLRQIEGAAMFKKPEKKASRTGVRNPNAKPKVEVLPADPSVKETENELLQRQEAQATCRFQIFPKSKRHTWHRVQRRFDLPLLLWCPLHIREVTVMSDVTEPQTHAVICRNASM